MIGQRQNSLPGKTSDGHDSAIVGTTVHDSCTGFDQKLCITCLVSVDQPDPLLPALWWTPPIPSRAYQGVRTQPVMTSRWSMTNISAPLPVNTPARTLTTLAINHCTLRHTRLGVGWSFLLAHPVVIVLRWPEIRSTDQHCTPMTTTKFNITQVHRITGKSRTTIKKHIKQGKLSAEQDDKGNPVIDAAELVRLYDVSTEDFERATPIAKNSIGVQPGGDQSGGQLVSSMQERLDSEIRIRERLERQFDELNDVLKRTQDSHDRAMRLIEDRSQRVRDWEQPLKQLRQQVANHQQEHQEYKTKASKRIAKLQQAMENERTKSWFARLIG